MAGGHGPMNLFLFVARAVMCQKLDRAILTAVRICQAASCPPHTPGPLGWLDGRRGGARPATARKLPKLQACIVPIQLLLRPAG